MLTSADIARKLGFFVSAQGDKTDPNADPLAQTQVSMTNAPTQLSPSDAAERVRNSLVEALGDEYVDEDTGEIDQPPVEAPHEQEYGSDVSWTEPDKTKGKDWYSRVSPSKKMREYVAKPEIKAPELPSDEDVAGVFRNLEPGEEPPMRQPTGPSPGYMRTRPAVPSKMTGR